LSRVHRRPKLKSKFAIVKAALPPEVVRWVTLLLAILFFCAAVATGRSLVEAERTGVALYYDRPGSVASKREWVTRDREPDKFRSAVGVLGLYTAMSGAIGLVSFSFHRRLSK
jgi:hypothetical protein